MILLILLLISQVNAWNVPNDTIIPSSDKITPEAFIHNRIFLIPEAKTNPNISISVKEFKLAVVLRVKREKDCVIGFKTYLKDWEGKFDYIGTNFFNQNVQKMDIFCDLKDLVDKRRKLEIPGVLDFYHVPILKKGALDIEDSDESDVFFEYKKRKEGDPIPAPPVVEEEEPLINDPRLIPIEPLLPLQIIK